MCVLVGATGFQSLPPRNGTGPFSEPPALCLQSPPDSLRVGVPVGGDRGWGIPRVPQVSIKRVDVGWPP